MVNLIGSNNLLTRKQFVGYFCNAEEAQAHAQGAVTAVLNEEPPLKWEEVAEYSLAFKAFMTGTLLPARVLRAHYADSCLFILDYDY